MRRIFFLCLSVVFFQGVVLADDSGNSIRIATYNMHGGKGHNTGSATYDDYEYNLTAFKNLLQGEQILCFQEVDDWNLVQSVFSDWPHTYYTENETTKWFSNGTTAIAIVSKLPIVASNFELIQTDPGGDKWERHAQHVQVSLDDDRVLHVFNFHNTYNWFNNDYEYEQSGLVSFREWVLDELGTAGVNQEANVVMLGDYNLLVDKVGVILPTYERKSNSLDHLNSPLAFSASGAYGTYSMNISDHNAVWATVDPGEDPGETVFEATTANTMLFNNGNNGDASNISLTGATPDLLMATDGGNFFAGGFASTGSINTLNGGTALTYLDSVTIHVTVDSITHIGSSELRSRGLEFGMAAAAELDGGTTTGDNLILKLGGGGNSTAVAMVDSFATFSQAAFTIDPASMADGFGVTLFANEEGFTFSFRGVTASSGSLSDLSGTFAPGEFVNYFGAGHYYASAQKRLVGTTTLDISVATLSVNTGVPQSLPYAEGFESGLGDWQQASDDDFDWSLNSGYTDTANTGPSEASEGSQYLYVEGHDSGIQYKTAQVDCDFDLSTAERAELTFDYHMYGFYIDFLAVDVYDGSAWSSNVWKKTGQQHTSSESTWSNAVVDLSAFIGNDVVTIRFRGKQKQWHAADTAIDNIQVVERTAYEQWGATAFSGAPGGTDETATGNPDGDQLNNKLEWALVTNPMEADEPPIDAGVSNANYVVTYVRRDPSVTGIDVYASWATSLTNEIWKLDGDGLTESSNGWSNDVETVSASLPLDHTNAFIRIQAEEH